MYKSIQEEGMKILFTTAKYITNHRNSNMGMLIAFAFLYVAVFGSFIYVNDFIPYVFDNNESFSSLLHARNIFEFGLRGSWGLTDESVGTSLASGPVLYTHNGNFPRLYALLLYTLGARSVESQIAITTMTVGLGGFLYSLYITKRLTSPMIASIFGVLMLSDYVMSVQWQVNTWQVWRFAFLFSSLHAVIAVSERPDPKRLALGALNFACLFYYDIVFAIFISITVCFYGLWTHPRRRPAIAIIGAIGIGSATAACLLVSQNILALGWDVFLTDLRYTYLGRNFLSSPDMLPQAESFYRKHNIVDFLNLSDSSIYRHPIHMLRAVCMHVLGVYTPTLSIVLILLGGAAAIATIPAARGSLGKLLNRYALSVFAAATALCSFAILRPMSGAPISRQAILGAFFLLICLDIARRLPPFAKMDPVPPLRLYMGAGLFCTVAVILWWQNIFFKPAMSPLYGEVAAYTGRTGGSISALLLTLWLSLSILLQNDTGNASARAIGRLTFCSIVALAAIFFFSPGYVVNITLSRTSPLTIDIHLLVFALGIHTLIRQMISLDRAVSTTPQGVLQILSAGRAAAASGLLLFIVVSWGLIQGIYVLRLPGDGARAYKLMEQPPFRGASFVTSTYATPAALSTGNWAYFDARLHENRVSLTDRGFEIKKDSRYLWFKDWRTNPAYNHPEYYLCFNQSSLLDALPLQHLRPRYICDSFPLVHAARTGGHNLLAAQQVVRDKREGDRWAILRLNWASVPYPARLNDGDLVQVTLSRAAKHIVIQPHFQLGANSPKPKRILYLVNEITSCDEEKVWPVMQTSDPRHLVLPKNSSGTFQVEVRLDAKDSPLAVRLFARPFSLRDASLPIRCPLPSLSTPFAFLNEGASP